MKILAQLFLVLVLTISLIFLFVYLFAVDIRGGKCETKHFSYKEKYVESLENIKTIDFNLNNDGDNYIKVIKTEIKPRVVVEVSGGRNSVKHIEIHTDIQEDTLKFYISNSNYCLDLKILIFVKDPLKMIRGKISNGNVFIKSIESNSLLLESDLNNQKNESITILNSKVSQMNIVTATDLSIHDLECIKNSSITLQAKNINSSSINGCDIINIEKSQNITIDSLNLVKGKMNIKSNTSYVNITKITGMNFFTSSINEGNVTLKFKDDIKSTLIDLKTGHGKIEVKNIIPNWFRDLPNQKQGTIQCIKHCDNDIHVYFIQGNITIEKIKP